MIQLVIPMSGQGVRFQHAGYALPKPLIPVSERPMIERLLESFPTDWPTTFILAENHRQSQLPNLLEQLRKNCRILYIPPHTEGPIRPLEAALNGLQSDAPVLVSYCDYGMIWDPHHFARFVQSTKCDACVISYRGFHAHYLGPNTYAYSRLDGERVVEVKEKGSFTPNRENEYASSGGYYFKSAATLKRAMTAQRTLDLKINGEFYTSLTVEALLRSRQDCHVRVYEIPYFFQWGTPEDLTDFQFWESTFDAYNKYAGAPPGEVPQILMPMAGAGSRFQGAAHIPKPLIPVIDTPMYLRALQSLPTGRSTMFVALEKFKNFALSQNSSHKWIFLSQTPAGQALSTQAGLKDLDPQKSTLISSCDHSIVLNPTKWNKFIQDPDCDGAIFTIRNFPGARRKPQAYAYVQSEGSPHDDFPLIQNVSVKRPVSSSPAKDALLVGTFWVASPSLLEDGIKHLIRSDRRVNGELYLDSVFQILIEKKLRIREISLDGYINWGDPDSLAEALYWYQVFVSRFVTQRPRIPGMTTDLAAGDRIQK